MPQALPPSSDLSLTGFDTAPQHGPRPLPLFLDMLRSETAASPERMAAALAGLRAYQEAPRTAPPAPAPVASRHGRARLHDHGTAATPPDAPAVLVVPSLINPPFILDLAPGISVMAWLAEQGVRPFLLDWGSPEPGDRELDLTGHVERVLLPMLAGFATPPVVIGYCLGGTLALGAAAAATRLAGVALIAAPWRFAGFGAALRQDMLRLWRLAEPTCRALGQVPMEVLQSGFWQIDPARTIAKYEQFGRTEPGSLAARSFVALEDWANGGAPLTYAAGRQLFEAFVARDLTGAGGWRIAGHIVDPAALSCPTLDIVSRRDRIVPAATAADLPQRLDVEAGHVGMIVGRRARHELWEPLAAWLNAIGAARPLSPTPDRSASRGR